MQIQECLAERLVLAFCLTVLPRCLVCASLLLTFTGISLQAATYTVAQRDPKAGDDGPGSAERPWKSLTKAAEKAEPGDIVLIRDGVYKASLSRFRIGTGQQKEWPAQP